MALTSGYIHWCKADQHKIFPEFEFVNLDMALVPHYITIY